MKNRISIIATAYFPLPFILLGTLVLITAGIGLSERYGAISLLLIPAGIFVLTAHYRLTINLVNKTYHDHLWIIGLKRGTKKKFSSVEGLHITESPYRQTFSNFTSSTTKRGIEYNGYIRLDEESVHLFSSTNKNKVVKKLERVQRALQGDTVSSTELTTDSSITDHTNEH